MDRYLSREDLDEIFDRRYAMAKEDGYRGPISEYVRSDHWTRTQEEDDD